MDDRKPRWIGTTRMAGAAIRLGLGILVLGGGLLQASPEFVKSDAPAHWARLGRYWFGECEFKKAARAFESAVADAPEDASLHHRLGKSYARMAEVASPLHASRDARKARRDLVRAVELAPGNREYVRELFEFYLDSPEWFGGGGGLREATALLKQAERTAPTDPTTENAGRARLATAREEYRGPTWWIRQGILRPAEQFSRLAPQR